MSAILQVAQMFNGASTNRRIFRAAASVTVAGILVKLVATFKEITVAGAYGRSDNMDAYLAAMLIPALLINLISESMNQALVPTLIRVKELEGQRTRPGTAFELHAVDVRAARCCRGHHGVDGTWFFPADCLAFSAGQAGSLHPALLCAAARRADLPASPPIAPRF